MLLDTAGIEIDRLVGAYVTEEYLQDLKDYANGKNTFTKQKEQIKDEPNNYNLIVKLAEKYFVRNDTINSLKYFLKATQHEEGCRNAHHYYMTSLLYQRLERIDKAINYCEKAIELKPESPYYKKHLEKLKTEG